MQTFLKTITTCLKQNASRSLNICFGSTPPPIQNSGGVETPQPPPCLAPLPLSNIIECSIDLRYDYNFKVKHVNHPQWRTANDLVS